MKNQVTVLKDNMIGAAAGGLALFFLAKKLGHTGMAVSVIAVVAGVALGANIQNAFKHQTNTSI